MAKYRITAPTGEKYEITAPEGASEQEVLAYFQSQLPKNPQVDYGASPDPLNVNPFEAPTGQLQAPQGGVTMEPSVAGVPVSQMEGPGASPTTTMMDRVQAIPGVRALGGAVRTAYGAGQVASELVGSGAEAVGLDRSTTDQLRDEFTRRIGELDAQANRGLTNARNPLDPLAPVLPDGYQNMNIAGMVGQALPFMAATPAVGLATKGLAGAAARTAYAGATGAVGGYLAPQEGEVSLDTAERNAIVGALLGAGIGGLVEAGIGIREIIKHLSESRAGQVILDTIEPDKLATVIDELRTSRPAIPGYAPRAEDAAVAADQPNFAGLGMQARKAPGVADDVMRQTDARQLAQAEQLGRVNAANVNADVAAGPGTAAVPAPALPLDEITAGARLEAQQAGMRQSGAGSSRAAILGSQADQLAAVDQQAGLRVAAETQARTDALAAARQALDEEADALPAALTTAKRSEMGAALTAAARAEKADVDARIIRPAYDAAFEAAGDAKAALPGTAAAVRSVLGSQTAVLSTETAPQTLQAMAKFGLTPEQVAAAAEGGVPIGNATLRQINDARVAINADYARAKNIPNAALRGQTLDHLTQIKAALDADLAASSLPQEAKDLYQTAVGLWRTHSLPRFRTGNVSTKLFQTNLRNVGAIDTDKVTRQFLSSENSAREFVRLYTNAEGVVNQEAATAMRAGVEREFRDATVKGGTFDVKAAEKWLQAKADQLGVLDEAMPGLRQSLTQYRDTARRIVMTRAELDSTAKTVTKDVEREVQAAAEAERAAVRARTQERLVPLDVRQRRLAAEAREAQRVAKLLTFKDGDDMAAKVLANPEIRTEVIQRSGRNARLALAQRATWEVNNAGSAADRLAFIDQNEDALREIYRAAGQQADDTIDGLRTAAQEAARQEASVAAGRTQQQAMNARLSAARRAVKDTPVEGKNLEAYQADRERLSQGFTDEQMSSLEALELDIAREKRVLEQARAADPTKSELQIASQIQGSHGIPGIPERIWRITKYLLNIGGRSVTEAQATQIARIMADPALTADTLEAAVRARAGNAAVNQTVRTIGRGAAIGAGQQGADQ